jgi:hypothetical protein
MDHGIPIKKSADFLCILHKSHSAQDGGICAVPADQKGSPPQLLILHKN